MAACMLCQRLPQLRRFPGLRTSFARAQCTHAKPEGNTDDQEEKKRALQHQEAFIREGYRVHYNPSSYHHSAWNSAVSRSQTENDEDEQCLPTHALSFWQKSNRYSVSCSRHLCSTTNALLNLAFNKSTECEIPSSSSYLGKLAVPDIQVDSRAFIRSRPEYSSMTLDLTRRPDPIQWEDAMRLLKKIGFLRGRMKPSDVSQFLLELGRLHPDKVRLVWSDQCFISLLRYSVEHLCLFTTLQLLEVMRSFVWLDIHSAHTVLDRYEAELIRRADQMTLHELLLAADLWRCIGKQGPEFLRHLYNSVPLHLGQVGVPELVHLMYIIGEGRHFPKHLFRPLEQLLMDHLQKLHPEEIGTVCLALFKSQTAISETTVNRVIDKAHSVVKEMSDFAIANVMKFMRFNYQCHWVWMEAMAQEVPKRANGMGVQGLMHVALTCSALHYSNDNILTAIADRVPSLVPHCRIKDSSKLLWAFGMFGYPPAQSPSFYPSLTEAMRQRKAESKRFPEHLLTGLLGLALVSQFPEDLIALALSPNFVNVALRSTQLDMRKDLFTLDQAVGLELPEWTGPRISSELKEEVTEMLWKFAQSDVCQKPEVLEAESALQYLLGGEKFVCKRMILPHTRSIDLEVHFNSDGEPIPVDLVASPEQGSSAFPSNQGWEKLVVGVNITDNLLAQLMNRKNTTGPSAPPSSVKPASLHGLQADEETRLFDTLRNLTGDIPETLTRFSRSGLAQKDPKGPIKIAIQVPSRNSYCFQSQQLFGLNIMKRRQLKMVGFKVVDLSYHEWFPMLRKTRAEKLAYLHCKIYDKL